ncbi:MAG TPA: metal-sulfur cluster assembly factor [Thermodesulfobacteriota bacterium]|nr:metal-sulfur cluster assembly factor [Thermodesulfobacteriota bacterium]
MGLGKFLSGLFSGGGETPGEANQGNDAVHVEPGEVNSAGNSVSAPPAPSPAEARPEDDAPAPLEEVVSDEPPGAPPTVTEEKVLEALSNVYDPEIPIDIVNLGLIYGVEIDGGNVRIEMTMTAPGCPVSGQIAGESRLLVEEIPGVESVDIELVWDPPWDPSKMSEEAQQSLNF